MIHRLLRPFLRCPCCARDCAPRSLLCELCSRGLLPAPPLCPRCGQPAAAGEHEPACPLPWRRLRLLDGLGARYLAVGSGHEALKRWKYRGGSWLRDELLQARAADRKLWRDWQPEALVPVPQGSWRAWRLGRSPAMELAAWIARETGIPLRADLLQHAGPNDGLAARSLAMGSERWETRPLMTLGPGTIPRRALLVDDVMTTGSTLVWAARCLRSGGAGSVFGYCLGIRPGRQSGPEAEISGLRSRPGDSEVNGVPGMPRDSAE
ncbi:MAG: ComF family protein [Bdellovibrionales bacterium]|nr:ComF family protein [Bdellovibrionales bacterium]